MDLSGWSPNSPQTPALSLHSLTLSSLYLSIHSIPFSSLPPTSSSPFVFVFRSKTPTHATQILHESLQEEFDVVDFSKR